MIFEHENGGPRTPRPETAAPSTEPTDCPERTTDVDGVKSTVETRLLDIAEFPPGEFAKLTPRRISEEDIARLIENPGRRKEGPSYVLGTFRGGRRSKAAVISRCAGTLDVDRATEDTWKRSLDLPFRAYLHTTYSSTEEDLRLRLIVPFDRDVAPEEYPRIVAAVADYLGDEAEVDPKSKEPEQLMFRPAVADEHREWYRFAKVNGPTASADGLLASAPALPETPRPVGDGTKRDPREIDGTVGAFNRAYSIAEAIETFGIPYESAGEGLWRPVGSTHAAGVREFEPGLVYSHHVEDPAYGQALCAFDLVRVHLYGILDEDAAEGTPVSTLPSTLSLTERLQSDPRVAEELRSAEKAGIDTDFEDLGEDPFPFEHPAPRDAFDRKVEEELVRLRVREEARRRFAAENLPEPVQYDAGTLAEHLLKPPPPAERVGGLIPWAASTAIIAMRKTGKTTFELNLARSLITGEPFLDRFDVRPIDGNIAFLNFEVSGATLTAWAAEAGIPEDRFLLVNLRGSGNPFASEEDLARLGALLRKHNVESLIVDPFGRAFTGDSQNDAGQVQRWLLDLDRFAREYVGALDVVLSVHAGWDGERTRGSSAIEDWADSLIYLTKDQEAKDDPARFLRADGRDIDVPEDQLHFDHSTRRLSLTGRGSRRASRAARKVESLVPDVVEVIEAEPGILTGAIEKRLRDAGIPFQKGDGSKTAREAEERNLVRSKPGGGTAVRWFPEPGGVVFPPDEEEDPLGEGPRRGSPK